MKRIVFNLLAALTDPGEPPSRGWYAPILLGLQTLAQVAARLYVARVFLYSGLTKLHDWGTTLALFNDEYHVPVLPPELAAYMSTAGELGLSTLLVLGLGGRFAAIGLSVINVVAATSLDDIAPAALMGHYIWGTMLIVLMLWGPGQLSLDRWLYPKLSRSFSRNA